MPAAMSCRQGARGQARQWQEDQLAGPAEHVSAGKCRLPGWAPCAACPPHWPRTLCSPQPAGLGSACGLRPLAGGALPPARPPVPLPLPRTCSMTRRLTHIRRSRMRMLPCRASRSSPYRLPALRACTWGRTGRQGEGSVRLSRRPGSRNHIGRGSRVARWLSTQPAAGRPHNQPRYMRPR